MLQWNPRFAALLAVVALITTALMNARGGGINFNTDVSDFRGFSATGFRPIDESNQAYKLSVNYIICGLTPQTKFLQSMCALTRLAGFTDGRDVFDGWNRRPRCRVCSST